MNPAVSSHVDEVRRTAVITTRFEHPVEVVWTLWSDAAKLARWWGPPGMPMTVDHHDLRAGGSVELTVDTPGGTIRGRWSIHAVAAPHALAFTFESDGLDPTEISVEITAASPSSTAMTVTARFASDAAMHHAVEIGFVAGVARSCAQAPSVLDA